MNSIDLVNYISQARQSGMSDDKIRSGLRQAGWQDSDIDDFFKRAEPPPASATRPKIPIQRSKLLAAGLASVIAAVLGYTGAAYYMKLYPFQPEALVPVFTPGPMLSPSSSLAPSASPVESSALLTASWETYSNEQYGLEFKHPNTWVQANVKTDNAGIVWINFSHTSGGNTENVLYIKIFPNSSLFSTEENIVAANATLESVTVDNRRANYYPDFRDIPTVFMAKDNLFLQIGNSSSQKYLKEILSTFRFTK